MPQTVNGIGTWYYGKRNLRARRGTCEFCGSHGDLQSYETTLFFVVVFIPLIPLGAKRINDDCPSCRRHNVSSLKKWNEARDVSIAEEAAKLDENPGDLQTAIKAISCAAYFDAKDECLGIVASLSPELLKEPELLNTIADVHRHFGMGVEAASYYRQSLAIKADRAVSLRLAAVLFSYNSYADATLVAEPLLQEHKLEDFWLLTLYISAMQAAGAHDRAMVMLDGFAAAHPTLLKDKHFKKMQRVSEKYRDSGKPIASKLLNVKEFKESEGSVRFRIARFIGPVIAIVVLSIYLFVAYNNGQNRRIYLVNGTTYPYEVVIGSQTFSVSADSQRFVTVPEDTYTISVNHPLNLIPSFQADLSTNFFTRPFNSPITVINPDSLGLVFKCTATYARNPPPSTYELFTGKQIHELGKIDCPFTPLPAKVSVKSNSYSSEKRTSLELSSAVNFDSLGIVGHYLGAGEIPDRVVNGLKIDPECETYLFASSAVPQEDLEQTIEPLLKIRPVLVNVHRLHQDTCETHHPKFDLQTEYQTLLHTDPKNPALLYLRARVTHDPKERIATYIAAAAGDSPHPYAARALAKFYLDSGEFDLAARYADQVMKLIPWDQGAQQVNRSTLFARSKFAECLETPHLRATPNSTSAREAADKIVCLAALHKHDEAVAYVQAYLAEEGPGANELRDQLLSILAYCENDLTNWTRYNQPGGNLNFDALIQTGAIAEAAKLVTEDSSLEDRFTLILGAYIKNDSTLAQAQLDLVINEFASATFDDRLAATWLAGTATPTEAQLLYCVPREVSRALFLAVLGHCRPDLAPKCLPLANTLNFDPRFPHLLIAKAASIPPQ